MSKQEKSGLEKAMARSRQGQYGFDVDGIKNANSGEKFQTVRASDIRSELETIYTTGKQMGRQTGLKALNKILRWRRKGGLYCISAYPQAGKSEFIKYLSVQAAELYEWKTNIFSPEEDVDDIYEDLCRVYLGKNINKNFKKGQCTKEELDKAIAWVDKHYNISVFDGMADFEKLISHYEDQVHHGYNIFITDPWNAIAEGNFENSKFGNSYLKTALTHMHSFAKRNAIQNVIVEHQNRPQRTKDGSFPKAHVRNITGGQMWENKCDAVVILHNNWDEENEDTSVTVQTAKSKNHRYNGRRGTATIYFDIQTGRYDSKGPDDSQLSIDEKPPEIGDVPF